MRTNDYIFEIQPIEPQFNNEPRGIHTPDGYRLHSWHPSYLVGGGPGLHAVLCFERKEAVSTLLDKVPAEWVAPGLEWIKRWVIKQ